MYESDEEYLAHLEADRNARMQDLIDVFPDFRMRLKMNPRAKKIEYGADVTSVFDICWYTFGRLAADIAPPMNYTAWPAVISFYAAAAANGMVRARIVKQSETGGTDAQATPDTETRGEDSAIEE